MKWLPGMTALYILLISCGCSGPDYRLDHPRAASEVLNIRERDHQQALKRGAPPEERPEDTPSAQTHPPSRPAATPAGALSEPPAFGSYQYHALVIGINAYTRRSRLKTAVQDARAVAQLLESRYGFQVKLLTDASRSAILTALEQLKDTLTERDNFLLYYAGHGFQDEDKNRYYWIPVDGDEKYSPEWIPTYEITDTLRAMQAKQVMVVADSCYAAMMMRGSITSYPGGASPRAYALLAQKRARIVLTSGGAEPVADGGGRGHSIFARAFLSALTENATVLEGARLHLKVREAVMVAASQMGLSQEPQYTFLPVALHDGGDFLFVPKSRPLS